MAAAFISIAGIAGGTAAALLVIRRLRRWSPRWASSAQETVSLPLSPGAALSRAEQALAVLPLRSPAMRGTDGRSVCATVRGNWMTFGNTVEFVIEVGDGGTTSLLVSSRPVTPQLFDWGRSRGQVQQVAGAVTSASAARG